MSRGGPGMASGAGSSTSGQRMMDIAKGCEGVNTFTAAEIEFLAEDVPVTILPNFSMDPLELIQGAVGPFQPSRPVDVPLWLAIVFKKRQKCKIQPPSWLEVEFLTEARNRERDEKGAFVKMPDHFMEISLVLLDNAPDDVPMANQVRLLLQDLWETRYAKARNGLRSLDAETTFVQLNNMSQMELNMIRPFFAQAMDQFFSLRLARDSLTQDDQDDR